MQIQGEIISISDEIKAKNYTKKEMIIENSFDTVKVEFRGKKMLERIRDCVPGKIVHIAFRSTINTDSQGRSFQNNVVMAIKVLK